VYNVRVVAYLELRLVFIIFTCKYIVQSNPFVDGYQHVEMEGNVLGSVLWIVNNCLVSCPVIFNISIREEHLMAEKMKLLIAAVTVVSLSVLAGGQAEAAEAAGVDPRGQVLAFSCASCHGTDGKSVSIIPSFYGKSPEYLETALMDFKSGKRYSTVMMRHAKGYTDEEIRLIAQYYGTVWQTNN